MKPSCGILVSHEARDRTVDHPFSYEPEEIQAFINSVGHPLFGLHLDQMKLVSQANFHRTTDLINTTIDLLADVAVSAYVKDINGDPIHVFLKWDEVTVDDGAVDYETYVSRLAKLPADPPCLSEHLREEHDYGLNFARLHYLADQAGVRFLPRDASTRRDPAQEVTQ